jgi:hypothetical protein
VFPHTTEKNKICAGPRDSVKIRSSSWSAKVCPGLVYNVSLNHTDARLISVFIFPSCEYGPSHNTLPHLTSPNNSESCRLFWSYFVTQHTNIRLLHVYFDQPTLSLYLKAQLPTYLPTYIHAYIFITFHGSVTYSEDYRTWSHNHTQHIYKYNLNTKSNVTLQINPHK